MILLFVFSNKLAYTIRTDFSLYNETASETFIYLLLQNAF